MFVQGPYGNGNIESEGALPGAAGLYGNSLAAERLALSEGNGSLAGQTGVSPLASGLSGYSPSSTLAQELAYEQGGGLGLTGTSASASAYSSPDYASEAESVSQSIEAEGSDPKAGVITGSAGSGGGSGGGSGAGTSGASS